jgi:twitching motility protein PilT
MSTLHTLDATETINRIVSVFPPYQQKQVRLQLGSVLKAVISQRLVPRADGKGRVAAVEILKATARVRELIEDKDRTKEINDAIAQGHQTYGTQTFDQSLMQLVRQGLITYDEAYRQASNPDDFALRFSGISATGDSKWDDFEGRNDGASAPGSVAFAQRGAPTTGAAPPAASPRPAAVPRPPPQPLPTPPRAASPPPQTPRAATPQPQAAAGGEDDFTIERF